MSFRKPIDFLLREPSIALPIKQALREAVAAEVHTPDAHVNSSGDSCIEYFVCGKVQLDSPEARRNAATKRIASVHGV
jgi:hypothetical protein